MMKSFFSRNGLTNVNSLFTANKLSTSAMRGGARDSRAAYVRSTDLSASSDRHFVRYREQRRFHSLPLAGDVNSFRLFATTEQTPIAAATAAAAVTEVPVQNDAAAATAAAGSAEAAAQQCEKKDKKKKKGKVDAQEVIVLGLSHHNAKVDVREKLAIPEDEWNDAAALLAEYPAIGEAAVLSTCNRFELYLAGKNQYAVMRDAIDFLYQRAKGQLDQRTLRQNLFMLSGEDAIWHLLRVSAGLDSLVVGEGQILAQVKRSYERSIEKSGSGGKVVSRLLNVAVSSGKRVRAETGACVCVCL